MLHYKLEQNIQILDNCYSYPTFDTSSQNGGWRHWGRSGANGSFDQNTDKKYIYNKINTYSHWVSNDSDATGEYLVYQSPAFDGGYRSLQAIIKEENSKSIDETICFPAWNARNGGTASHLWTSIISLGNGFYLCKCEGISQDGSDDLVGIYVKPGYKIYISEAYLENDKEICSEILYHRNYITDSSGYGYDGTIAEGTLTIKNDSNRYNYSSYFNGSTSINLQSIYDNTVRNKQLTVACWIKYTQNPTQDNFIYRGLVSIYIKTAYNSNPYPLFISWNHATDSSTSGNAWYAGYNTIINTWFHVCYVFNAGIWKLYINGQHVGTSDRASTGTYIYGNKGNDFGTNFIGMLNDLRVYSTALSAEDVLDLYHTPASIDNLGNAHAFEFIEDSDKDSIYKNGTVSSSKNINYLVNNFGETNTMTDWSFGGSPIQSNGVVIITGTSPGVNSKTFTVNPDDIIVIEIGVQLTKVSTTSGAGIYLGTKYGQSTSTFTYDFTTNQWALNNSNSTNPYFISGYNSTDYYHCRTYLLGSNKTIDDIPMAAATNTRRLYAIKLNSDTTTNIRSGYNTNTEMIIKLSDFKIYNINEHGLAEVSNSAKTGLGYLQYNDFIEK